MIKIPEQFPASLEEEKEKQEEKSKLEEKELQSQLLKAEFRDFLEKKGLSLKHKDFTRIIERYDGEPKYVEELKVLGTAMATIEDCPEKEIFARLFIKASLGLRNYGQAFLAAEFIKDAKEQAKIKTDILENRINYFKNYFKEELKLPDKVNDSLLLYLKDYRSIPRVYPTGEKVKWPVVYKQYRDFLEEVAKKSQLPWDEKILIEWEKQAVEIEEPEKIEEKIIELKKAGVFDFLKKPAEYGAMAVGGLMLTVLLFLIAPAAGMAVGFYTGVKELIKGLPKELGIEEKKEKK